MPAGRPTDYTPELGDKICQGIAEGISLVKQCKEEGMPNPSSIYKWRREMPEFSKNYDKAREDQADLMVEEMLDIADNEVEQAMVVHGEPVLIDGKLVMVKDAVSVSHAKLRVDTRKWAASKFKPNTYAEKIKQDIEHSGDITTGNYELSDTERSARIAALLERGRTRRDGQSDT